MHVLCGFKTFLVILCVVKSSGGNSATIRSLKVTNFENSSLPKRNSSLLCFHIRRIKHTCAFSRGTVAFERVRRQKHILRHFYCPRGKSPQTWNNRASVFFRFANSRHLQRFDTLRTKFRFVLFTRKCVKLLHTR